MASPPCARGFLPGLWLPAELWGPRAVGSQGWEVLEVWDPSAGGAGAVGSQGCGLPVLEMVELWDPRAVL